MKPILVDHTDPQTAAALVALQRASYRVEADLTGIEAIPPLRETAGDLASKNHLTVLACIDEGAPVAMVGYDRDGDVVDIDRLAVAPGRFRRGHARALLSSMHERESDAASFTVSTGKGNAPAAALYAAMGYISLGHEEIRPGLWVERFRREVG